MKALADKISKAQKQGELVQVPKATLEEMVVRYYQVDSQMKKLDEEKKPLNTEIKAEMKVRGLKVIECDGIVASYNVSEKPTMVEELLLNLLKAKGLTHAIKTIEVPDQAVIETLLYEGVLTTAELANCMTKTETERLTVKLKKG